MPTLPSAPHETMRAYIVRRVDLLWAAKRAHDGEVIVARDERSDAAAEAQRLGYIFNY